MKAYATLLAGDVSAMAAFNRIATSLLAQMQANRQGVINGRDPEYLHQMRVAVRRLRALCGAYAKVLPKAGLAPLSRELKWLAHALGPARDADVFVTEIWPPLREALRAHPLCAALDARWAAQQGSAVSRLRRTLAAPRYQRFIDDFERWLAADVWRAEASMRQRALMGGAARDFARKALMHRVAKVRVYGRTLKHLDDAQLHALRIQLKKLRYTLDSFGPLFAAAPVQEMLAHLSRLQNVLGKMNDIRVAERQVAKALARRRGVAVIALHATFTAWRESRMKTLRHKLRAAWRDYRRAAPIG